MKKLKTILITLYLVLIGLLLLTNIKGCSNYNHIIEPREPNFEQTDSSLVKQAERTGNIGELKVTLLWNFQGDIDLHVIQPNGREIFFDNRYDRLTGGYLDVDNRDGGSGSAENIFWEKAREGEYIVSIEYYGPSKSTDIAEKGICSIVVFQSGKEPQTFNVEINTVNEKKNVTKIIINR